MPDDGTRNNTKILERWIEILNTQQFDRMEEVLDPEYVQEMPQSGERVRGVENMRQVLLHYPGGWDKAKVVRVESAEERPHYVMTATFNLVKVEGMGDMLWAYMKVRYPDGSDWYVPSFITFRMGKILKRTDFFALPFDPPSWRAPWVEHMET